MQRTESMPQLMTIKELADLLGVHPRTCRRLAGEAEDGLSDFPRPLRISPKVLRWRRTDVERYLSGLAGEPQA